MLRIFASMILCLFFTAAYSAHSSEPLPPEQAFEFSSALNNAKHQLLLEWHIAPGYHLYKDHLHIKLTPDSQVKIGQVVLPEGKMQKDDVLGEYQIYTDKLVIPVPLESSDKGILKLNVDFQGCSDKGYCFPPINKDVRLDVAKDNMVVTSEMQPQGNNADDQDYAQNLFQGSSKLTIIISFLGLGLLLAFTPCILPMIPILSGIIVGHGKNLTTTKAFLLSLAYVMGMAITYAIAGMIVALIGSRIQTIFQTTWVIVLMSGLFVLLSLSLFGFYELEEPKRLRNLFTNLSNKQKGGTYLGVFLMGALSSLIVSPCVSAPLVGVLAYIAQTGDMMLGAFALLALGFGMGIPLLLVGISAGKLLPKAGPWMESVKNMFGVLMLGVAIFILSRVIPGPATLFLWAVLLICCAIYLSPFHEGKHTLLRGFGMVMLVCGIILVVGAAMGNADPLRPWEQVGASHATLSKGPAFVVVKNMAQVDEALHAAARDHKPLLLDFYADWCVSCVKIDRQVFVSPDIQKLLAGFTLLRADVTKNNEFDKALLKRFSVIAPPTILFFANNGHEVAKARIVGEVDENEFQKHEHQLDLIQ